MWPVNLRTIDIYLSLKKLFGSVSLKSVIGPWCLSSTRPAHSAGIRVGQSRSAGRARLIIKNMRLGDTSGANPPSNCTNNSRPIHRGRLWAIDSYSVSPCSQTDFFRVVSLGDQSDSEKAETVVAYKFGTAVSSAFSLQFRLNVIRTGHVYLRTWHRITSVSRVQTDSPCWCWKQTTSWTNEPTL